MSKTKKEKKVRAVPIGIGVLVFILAFVGGAVSKLAIKPSWTKEYSVQMTDEIGTVYKDISYADGEANKFDLYVPAKYSLQGTTQGRYLTGGVPPVRFSM